MQVIESWFAARDLKDDSMLDRKACWYFRYKDFDFWQGRVGRGGRCRSLESWFAARDLRLVGTILYHEQRSLEEE